MATRHAAMVPEGSKGAEAYIVLAGTDGRGKVACHGNAVFLCRLEFDPVTETGEDDNRIKKVIAVIAPARDPEIEIELCRCVYPADAVRCHGLVGPGHFFGSQACAQPPLEQRLFLGIIAERQGEAPFEHGLLPPPERPVDIT